MVKISGSLTYDDLPPSCSLDLAIPHLKHVSVNCDLYKPSRCRTRLASAERLFDTGVYVATLVCSALDDDNLFFSPWNQSQPYLQRAAENEKKSGGLG